MCMLRTVLLCLSSRPISMTELLLLSHYLFNRPIWPIDLFLRWNRFENYDA